MSLGALTATAESFRRRSRPDLLRRYSDRRRQRLSDQRVYWPSREAAYASRRQPSDHRYQELFGRRLSRLV